MIQKEAVITKRVNIERVISSLLFIEKDGPKATLT
jgi:hypothetical protein